MTLDAALQGLKDYWKLRPTDGTRPELIALAKLRGFEEPLLNVWLDVFLAGCADLGYISSPLYSELAELVVSLGPDKAGRVADAIFLYLSTSGAPLDKVRKQDKINDLGAVIAEAAARIDAFSAAATAATDAIQGTAGLLDVTAALNHGQRQLQSRRDALIAQKDQLAAEVA